MATVDEETIQTQGFKDSSIWMTCPDCSELVEFPFTVELLMTATADTMQIDASIFGDRINEQPLYDHRETVHGDPGPG